MNAPQPFLRHPVVLAHGLLGFTRWVLGNAASVAYFRGIAERFEASGVRVVTPSVPPTGSIAERAAELAAAVRREVGSERVHIVAHSMGGLDARCAISTLGLAEQVVSLTTLGTPHRGSPVADRVMSLVGQLAGAGGLRRFGVDDAAFRDLRTGACKAFNAATPDAPGVAYRSIAGRKSRGDTTPALRLTHDVVAAVEGDNDGLVSVSSATWGASCVVVDADHVDLVGWTPPMAGPLGRPVDVGGIWAVVARGLARAEAEAPDAPGAADTRA